MKSNVISLFDKQNIQSKKVRLDSQNEDVDPQNLERVKNTADESVRKKIKRTVMMFEWFLNNHDFKDDTHGNHFNLIRNTFTGIKHELFITAESLNYLRSVAMLFGVKFNRYEVRNFSHKLRLYFLQLDRHQLSPRQYINGELKRYYHQ